MTKIPLSGLSTIFFIVLPKNTDNIKPNIVIFSWPNFSSEHLNTWDYFPFPKCTKRLTWNFWPFCHRCLTYCNSHTEFFLAINSQISFLSNTKTLHSVRFAHLFTHIFLVSCVGLFYVNCLKSTIISWTIKKQDSKSPIRQI